MKKNISVIIPAKNEEESIALMLKELPMEIIKEVIVIDGHSIDNTVSVVQEMGYKVVTQPDKGYGDAVSAGIKEASGEYITFIDADGSYDPKSLYQLQQEVEKKSLDVCFCSRYLKGGGSEDDTLIRYIGNKLFSFLLRLIHKVKISDALFLYCLVRKDVFHKLVMTSKNFDWCIEFPIRINQAKLKYSEIPSVERKRIAGESKVNALTDGIQIALRLLKLALKRL